MCDLYDPDIFGVLTPSAPYDLASKAFSHRRNQDRWEGVTDDGCPSRASTATVLNNEEGVAQPRSDNRLIVRFSDIDKLKNPSEGVGVQFGTNKNFSDVYLGVKGSDKISGRQFNLVLDDSLCVWLQDYYSTNVTAVRYNESTDEIPPQDRWILAWEPGKVPAVKTPTIICPNDLKFLIEFPNHASPSDRYLGHLSAYYERIRAALPNLDALGLWGESRRTTIAESRRPLSARNPYDVQYVDMELLGSGAQGEVWLVRSTRDGQLRARKTLKRPVFRKDQVKVDPTDLKSQLKAIHLRAEEDKMYADWKQHIISEYMLMKAFPHVSSASLQQTDEIEFLAYYGLAERCARPRVAGTGWQLLHHYAAL